MRCCVPLCKATTEIVSESAGISFHEFPGEAHLRAAWLRALGKQHNLPGAAVVCSQHFLNDDFCTTESGSRQIRTGAIPSMVQVCMMCLDTHSKLFLMSKYKLDEAYRQLVGQTPCDGGNLKQTLCVQCAQRLVNFSRFRDKSLRARALMMELLEKHELITIRHMKSINRVKHQLKSDFVKTVLEPDHCDVHIAHSDRDTQTYTHIVAVKHEEIHDSMLVDADHTQHMTVTSEEVSDADSKHDPQLLNFNGNPVACKEEYFFDDSGLSDTKQMTDLLLTTPSTCKQEEGEALALQQDITLACTTCLAEFADEDTYIHHTMMHMEDGDSDGECDTSQECEPHTAVSSSSSHSSLITENKMPRPPKRRRMGSHTEDQMKKALHNIKNGMSIRKAASLSDIAFTTVRRYYVKTKNSNIDLLQTRLTPNYSVNKIFSKDLEDILKDHFTHCAFTFYGLTAIDCRKLAYEMAKTNNLKMPRSWQEKQMAGKDWLLGFRKRNPELSLQKPEACSLARGTAFDRTNVERFYNNLEKLYQRNSAFADGTRIYNLDETSVLIPQKVIAPKGRRNIGQVTSGERGALVTMCCIISARGVALPPVMVFPTNNFKDLMIKTTPPGTLGLATPTGRINRQIFPEVMRHFIKHCNTTPENPSILILDNHNSHISIESLDIAKASGVHILTLHPHTSGKLQPLDVGVYGPLMSSYNAAIDSWMLRNPGKPVTVYDIGELIGNAFCKAMTPLNIIEAFKACGIFPFDRNLFQDEDFLPSSVTDRPCSDCAAREERP